MIYYFSNFIILTLVFFGINYFNSGYQHLSESHIDFFLFYILISSFFSVYFTPEKYELKDRTHAALMQFIFTLFSLSLVVSLKEFANVPRTFVFLITSLPVTFRWLMDFYRQDFKESITGNGASVSSFQYKRLITSLLLLILGFSIALFYKVGRLVYHDWLEQMVLLLIGLWWVSGHITRKFYVINDKNIYYKIAPIVKSHALFLLFSSAVYFFLKLDFFSRQLLFGSIGTFSIIETTVFLIVFMKNKPRENNYNDINLKYVPKEFATETNKIVNPLFTKNIIPQINHFIKDKRLISFIEDTFERTKMDCSGDSFIYLTTKNLKNFENVKNESQSMLINLISVNNILSINTFLLTMHQKVKTNGAFVGSFSPLEQDYKRLQHKMPRFLYTLIGPIHFILFRIFPKIPIISIIYDFITQGKGRYLSKAEVYGRLSYCGFKLLDSVLIDHQLFFIAIRKKSVSNESNPSYGPLVKLKRIGYQNRIFVTYKFRTMHPYSEFIQKEVFEKNNLTTTGKFNDDFRITSWGKIMRKLWIDELPQIFNWLQGDLTLIGVRALSKQYFSLYPKDLQELRIKVKPGLIPPYYADLPKNFDEILNSERVYLNKKVTRRFRTDFVYFFRALSNILLKGARSQ